MFCFSKVALPVVLGLTAATSFAANNIQTNSFEIYGSTEVSREISTNVGVNTSFFGSASHPEQMISKYEWDFDGDGVVDYSSQKSGKTSYTYITAGEYKAVFKAYTDDGTALPFNTVKVSVASGSGEAEISSPFIDQSKLSQFTLPASAPVADGKEKHYAVIINGGSETRFWDDMVYLYETLKTYGYSDEDIYLLNHNGTNPSDVNPNNMIDYSASRDNVTAVFNELASKVDSDDILHVFVDDHGNGYTGPVQRSASQLRSYGYNAGHISVDPGDEVDYIESEFKLRALVTYGDYLTRHGMNQWHTYKNSSNNKYYRENYVSSFSNYYFAKDNATVSDTDDSMELLQDYLKGDYNKNGVLDAGDITDFDGDGVEPYNPDTGEYDQDDWGDIDTFIDDYSFAGYGIAPAGCTYRKVFDAGLDNTPDLACSSDGVNYQIITTDYDNDGLFDGVDINQDGDLDDNVSIDETVSLFGSVITDDEFAAMLAPISAGKITIMMEQCFSGGFINDLSASNRVILTAAEEETVSWGNLFIRNVITSFSGINYSGGTSTDPAQADINGDGVVDFSESFAFASVNDYYNEIPQYDDNGDGISTDVVPSNDDGAFGATIVLQQNVFCEEFSATNSEHETAGRAYSATETTGQTCYGTFCFGGTTTTTWFAQGSDDNLGTSGSTVTVLNESATGVFAQGACPTPDTTAPVITLLGDNPLVVVKGTTYTEPGATAEDDRDGDISANITVTGYVDPNSIATYELVYSVSDAAGNEGIATRSVEVIEAPACEDFTDTVSNHESATRAYSTTETTGQTCYGTVCFGGTTTTTWFAQGSDENLGTSGSVTLTLRTNPTDAGFVAGECPAGPQAPTIDSTSARVVGDDVTISGTASDPDGDVQTVVLYFQGGGVECQGTTTWSCPAINDLPFGDYVATVKAVDSRLVDSDLVQVSFTVSAPVAPVIENLNYTVNGLSMFVTIDITDQNNDVQEVHLEYADQVGHMWCDSTGGSSYECDLTYHEAGTYSFKVTAKDFAGNISETAPFTVEFVESGECVTDTNYNHVDAGRAYVGGVSNLYAYGVGSDDDLGLYGSSYYSVATSLEETSAGVWTKVTSCP